MRRNPKVIVALALFLLMLLSTFPMIPKANAVAITPNFLVKIFFDPTTESWALDTGDIDMNDWPLTKDFISRWAARPDITMQEYAEIGKQEFDINCQWWPTGPDDPLHTEAAPRNIFYDGTDARHVAALHFRRGIAHLTDRGAYVAMQGGLAEPLYTEVPVPALAGYTDYASLENDTAKAERADNPYSTRGFLYEYSVDAAKKEFELGGFRDYDGDNRREWRDPGFDGIYGTGDDGPVEELPNMKFYIRIDDPNRRFAGEHLYGQLTSAAVGIPAATGADRPGLEKIVTERSACFNNVMVLYKYNIYTGGWSLGADLDFIYDLYHSSMGQYAWAQNYAGFKNTEFDVWAARVKYPKTAADVKPAAINAQWVKAKYMPIVEIYCAKAVKAYRTGWDNVVNMAGFGVDNSWSYHSMNWINGAGTSRKGPANTIVQGFKSDISALHVVSSEWLWDWNALTKIYDSLLGRNPYDLSEETGWMAKKWDAYTIVEAGVTKTVAEFELRTGLYWHESPDHAVTTRDVAFSLLMPKAAGAGVAWNYPMVMDIERVETSGQTIKVVFSVVSYWALHWVGFMPIIHEDLWMTAVNHPTINAGYTGLQEISPGVFKEGSFTNAMKVRDYRPWEMNLYKPGDGKLDLAEDGSFMYVFDAYVTGETITFHAFSKFYNTLYRLTQGWMKIISPLGTQAEFHKASDKIIVNIHSPTEYQRIHFLDDTTLEFLWPPGEPYPYAPGRLHFPADTMVTFPVATEVYYANGTGIITHAAGSSAFILASTKIDVKPGGQIRFSASTIIEFQYCYAIHFLDDSSIQYLGKGFTLYLEVQVRIFVAQEINVVLKQAFARVGNANYAGGWGNNFGWYSADNLVNAEDRYRVTRAMPTVAQGTWGPEEQQFNPDTDFNGDAAVNIIDKVIVNMNFLKEAG